MISKSLNDVSVVLITVPTERLHMLSIMIGFNSLTDVDDDLFSCFAHWTFTSNLRLK